MTAHEAPKLFFGSIGNRPVLFPIVSVMIRGAGSLHRDDGEHPHDLVVGRTLGAGQRHAAQLVYYQRVQRRRRSA